MIPRLGAEAVERLSSSVQRPDYRREMRGLGIAHLGLGAFARAHLAEYTEDALAIGGDWRIAGVSMRSDAVRNALEPQANLYTRVARDGSGAAHRLIGAIAEVIVAPRQPARLAALLAAPTTRIVSLTVTETGYTQTAADGALDYGHPLVAHDLRRPDDPPQSVLGLLAAAMTARHAAGLPPPTLLACDNLPANGERLRALLLAFLHAVGGRGRVADWVEARGAFPSTVVDRIVPAVTGPDLDAVATTLGVRDEAAVVTEPFRQWIVEERFVGDRPAWERSGAILVPDVRPYEQAKLRLLNAAHSALAYLGLLAGLATVEEAMRTPLGQFVMSFMLREAAPALSPSPVDLAGYSRASCRRFANPMLAHRLAQISIDGSQKLPIRLLPTFRANRSDSRPSPCAALILAAYIQHVSGVDLDGRATPIDDPLAVRFRSAADMAGQSPEELVPAILAIDAVFGRDLVKDALAVASVTDALRMLRRVGAIAAARTVTQRTD